MTRKFSIALCFLVGIISCTPEKKPNTLQKPFIVTSEVVSENCKAEYLKLIGLIDPNGDDIKVQDIYKIEVKIDLAHYMKDYSKGSFVAITFADSTPTDYFALFPSQGEVIRAIPIKGDSELVIANTQFLYKSFDDISHKCLGIDSSVNFATVSPENTGLWMMVQSKSLFGIWTVSSDQSDSIETWNFRRNSKFEDPGTFHMGNTGDTTNLGTFKINGDSLLISSSDRSYNILTVSDRRILLSQMVDSEPSYITLLKK